MLIISVWAEGGEGICIGECSDLQGPAALLQASAVAPAGSAAPNACAPGSSYLPGQAAHNWWLIGGPSKQEVQYS